MACCLRGVNAHGQIGDATTTAKPSSTPILSLTDPLPIIAELSAKSSGDPVVASIAAMPEPAVLCLLIPATLLKRRRA